MQGYIINIVKVKDEDLIVTLLTEKKLKTLYRFYGARHATINLGYKIDFEIQSNGKSTIQMLRQVLHLSNKWILDANKFYLWQQFIKLLYNHLRDVDEVESFYFELLNETNEKFSQQNPLRCIVEAYVKILEYEGRLHDDFLCFICNGVVDKDFVLTRGFLPAHQRCLFGIKLPKDKIKTLFSNKTTLFLEDDEIEILWRIIQEGL